jgi:hypothetical protein
MYARFSDETLGTTMQVLPKSRISPNKVGVDPFLAVAARSLANLNFLTASIRFMLIGNFASNDFYMAQW